MSKNLSILSFTANQLRALQATLASEIPISNAIGLTVVSCDQDGLTLAAPLGPNINHKDTAFAGSLNAVLTLAGWSLIWLIADAEAIPAKVVIQESGIRYLRPVTRDFAARCYMPERGDVERFLLILRRKGRARLELQADIVADDTIAVAFSGRYVVQIAAAGLDKF